MNWTKTLGALAVLAGVMGAPRAEAQTYVVAPPVSSTYVPLTSGTPVALSDADEGTAVVTLPFAFPYYGQTYNSVTVHSNGMLLLGSSCSGSVCYSNRAIPSSSGTFHSIIAGWWEDLDGASQGTVKHYSPSPTEWVVEYSNWGYFAQSGSVNFQIKLNAAGQIQFHYGTSTGTTAGASVGIENQDGTSGVAVLSCSPSCSPTQWPTNTLYAIGQPVQADLMVSEVNLSNMVNGASSLTFTVSPTFRNFGQTAANGFLWRAYLSTDRVLDGADTPVFTATTTVSVAGGSTASATGNVTVNPKPAPGQYFVLVEADHTNVVTEFSDTNNVGSTTDYFVSGVDLVAKSVSGPALSGPGNQISLAVSYFNQGTDSAGTVEYRVLLSADNAVDPADFVLYTGTKAITGAQTVSDTLTFAVPGNVPGGEFYYLLEVDSAAAVTEINENNNQVASSAQVKMEQADLSVEAVDVIDLLTGLPTRIGRIGELARFRVTLRNSGGADAHNFKVGIAISPDNNLSLLSDTIFHDEPVVTVAAGATTTLTFDAALPAQDKTNKNYVSGNYYLFAIADSFGEVTETNNNKSNNSLSVGPVLLQTPAADYTVARVDGPGTAAAGEVLPVFRVIRNIGNQAGAAVQYRFYASANQIITPDDVPLAIVGAGGTAEFGTVTLAAGAEDSATELVRLPASAPAGAYYVGCIVDTTEAVAELDESNNAAAGPSVVQVAPSSLRVLSNQLNDAMVGRPYYFRLVANDIDPANVWSVQATDGQLPEGLSLASDGSVTGTPARVEIAAFTVVVTNGARSGAARLVLRVLPPAAQLEVTSVALPPVINSPTVSYEAALGASGGVKPYSWKLVAGSLPNGIQLNAGGVLSGKPTPGGALGEKTVSVEVHDVMGNRASANLKLRVVEPGALVIRTLTIPDTLVNSDYLVDLVANNLDGSALAKPMVWSIAAGHLAPGLTLRTEQGERGIVEGKPTVAGDYSLTLQVEDAKGRTDAIDVVLRVFPARFQVTAAAMPLSVRPGEQVSFAFSSNGFGAVQFQLYGGQLPSGLALAGDGSVSGTVAEDALVGTHNFVIEARDEAGSVALGAFAVEVSRGAQSVGCSSTSGTKVPWVIALAVLFFFGWRKPAPWMGWGMIAAVVTLPAAGRAQSIAYEMKGPAAAPYVSLQGGTTLSAIQTYAGQVVNLPFPFQFYSQTHTAMTVSMHGYVTFGSDSQSPYNLGIPHDSSSSPSTFLAPWWDYLARPTGGAIKFQVTGNEPSRVATVEWSNITTSGNTSTFSFQLKLYEGSNQVRFHYGSRAPGSGTASIGVQETQDVGVAALLCTTGSTGSCGPSDFPLNQTIDFFLPPELVVDQVSVDPVGYAGVPFRAQARLRNTGGKAANLVSARFYLSSDNKYDAGDVAIGDTTPTSLNTSDETLASTAAPIPGGVVPGSYFVFVVVDPDGVVVEQLESNNVVGPVPVKVGAPAADLSISSVSIPATGTPGQSVQVQSTIRNGGNAATGGGFPVTYFLSDNDVVTASDLVLSTVARGAIASGADDAVSDSVTIPSDLKAGQYWIGLCVDYDPAAPMPGGIAEISEVNNCATAASPIVISAGNLAILTSALPGATQFAPYGLRLATTGGDGSYVWSQTAGSLPPGMVLAETGDLTGIPRASGSFGFSAKVQSGGAEATIELSLEVTPAGLSLALADQELPTGQFGRAYSGRLVAVGGKPPYLWSLTPNSRLPAGVGLSSDGQLEGRPVEAGEFLFGVEVVDTAGTQATQNLRLKVVTAPHLQIALSRMPTAVIGKDYAEPLQVVGGKSPYQWEVVRLQKLQENPTEPASTPAVGLPEGFGLKLEIDGSGNTLVRGIPAQAGWYAITVRVEDADKNEDISTLTLRVTYDSALALTTLALPDAFVGTPYDVKLSHNAGNQATDVVFSLACVQQVQPDLQSYACATDPAKQLPAGLGLDSTGRISGTPSSDLPAGGYAFLVRVSDASGREDVRALSIKLRTDLAPSAGCSGTSLPPSLWALLGLGLWGRARARRS